MRAASRRGSSTPSSRRRSGSSTSGRWETREWPVRDYGVSLPGSRVVATYRGRVWPANRRDEETGEIPVTPNASSQPATAPLLIPAPAARDVADPAREEWREELAE